MRGKRINKTERKRIAQLYRSGWRLDAIHIETGRSQSAISRIVSEAGLARRPHNGKVKMTATGKIINITEEIEKADAKISDLNSQIERLTARRDLLAQL